MKLFIFSISFTLLYLSTTIQAEAIPSFSRQIQADCRTCHFMGSKSLNKYGRQFKNNAFNESKEMRKQRFENDTSQKTNSTY